MSKRGASIRHRATGVFLISLMLAFGATSARSDPHVLQIWGSVIDPWGAPLARAVVSDGATTVNADAAGRYALQEIGFACYSVSASGEGAIASGVACLSLFQPSVRMDFATRYRSRLSVSTVNVSTANGPAAIETFLTTHIPPSRIPAGRSTCARLFDSRTGATSPMEAVGFDGSDFLWRHTSHFPIQSGEGTFEFRASVLDCTSGAQIDTGSDVRYIVDNTPPTILSIDPDVSGRRTQVTVRARDERSQLAGMEIRLDGTLIPGPYEWEFEPDGEVRFTTGILNLQPGIHEIGARALDRAGNARFGTDFIRVEDSLHQLPDIVTEQPERGSQRSRGNVDPPCIPPIVDSPARCTFDYYGYVTDLTGLPVKGSWITDGTRTTRSEDGGFYDLYQLQTGARTYVVFYLPGMPECYRAGDVPNTPDRALLEGGIRHDVQLPCRVPRED